MTLAFSRQLDHSPSMADGLASGQNPSADFSSDTLVS
jgi:hypothetical protein